MITTISFEIAKLLKEKGFDVKNRTQYQMYGTQNIPQLEPYNDTRWNIYKDYYLAPTIAEVVMWLYKKHGLWIYSLPIDDNMKLWQARIIKGEPFNKLSNTLKIISHGKISYRSMYSPTEAYEAAIEYTLNNLI